MTKRELLLRDYDADYGFEDRMSLAELDDWRSAANKAPPVQMGQGEYATNIKLKPGKPWRVIDAIIVVACFIAGAALVWATLPEAMK